MPVDRDIQLLEACNEDRSTMVTVAQIIVPRMLRYRKDSIYAARLYPVRDADDEATVEGLLTDAARVRLAVSRFVARYRKFKRGDR